MARCAQVRPGKAPSHHFAFWLARAGLVPGSRKTQVFCLPSLSPERGQSVLTRPCQGGVRVLPGGPPESVSVPGGGELADGPAAGDGVHGVL